MGFPQSPRAPTDISSPEPWGICDRCGFRWPHKSLNWQMDFRGLAVISTGLLVCEVCLDPPTPWNRPVIVGPDPQPVLDARPGNMAGQQQGTSAPSQQIVDEE